MARGSIVWRCRICGTRKTRGTCRHEGAQYSLVYLIPRWDAERGCVVKARKWETAGTDKDRASKQLADKLKSTHDGSYRELKESTFAAFADKWLAEYAKVRVKPSTYQGYESNVRAHLKVAFGPLALQTIREDTIQGYMASALKGGARPKSVKNHLITLKTMFGAAVKWGYLAFNPAASVKAPKVEREEMDILKPAEIRTLLGANKEGVAHIKPGWHVPIKFAIFTGLRQGEQLALRVGDLDFYNGQVCVRRTLTWLGKKQRGEGPRHQFGTPKSATSIRKVDLAPDLLEDLRRYVAGLPDQDPERLLFATLAGTPLDPRNVVERIFNKALAAAELRRIRWHDLRHTYASLQLAAGANIKYLSQQLGHASVQITLDRYSHLLQDSHPEQAARLSAFVFTGRRWAQNPTVRSRGFVL
jgi:integrase